jgi:hypothetical protein
MSKKPIEPKATEEERIPFDDALRRILKAPPAHKTSAGKKSTKKKKAAK